MSMWTEFRDSVVQTVAPQGVPTVSDAGNFVASELIKLGTPAKGNLNAAEIAAGQRGEAPHVSVSGSGVSALGLKLSIPMLIGLGVLGYSLLRKKR